MGRKVKLTYGDKLVNKAASIDAAVANRKILENIIDSLHNYNKSAVYMLSGMPKTGKTTLLYNAVKYVLDSQMGKPIVARFTGGVDFSTAFKAIQSLVDGGYNFIFLDGVSTVPGLVRSLIDMEVSYRIRDLKIIAAVDNPFDILMSNSALVDDVDVLHTDYMNYSDYCRIVTECEPDFMTYVKDTRFSCCKGMGVLYGTIRSFSDSLAKMIIEASIGREIPNKYSWLPALAKNYDISKAIEHSLYNYASGMLADRIVCTSKAMGINLSEALTDGGSGCATRWDTRYNICNAASKHIDDGNKVYTQYEVYMENLLRDAGILMSKRYDDNLDSTRVCGFAQPWMAYSILDHIVDLLKHYYDLDTDTWRYLKENALESIMQFETYKSIENMVDSTDTGISVYNIDKEENFVDMVVTDLDNVTYANFKGGILGEDKNDIRVTSLLNKKAEMDGVDGHRSKGILVYLKSRDGGEKGRSEGIEYISIESLLRRGRKSAANILIENDK